MFQDKSTDYTLYPHGMTELGFLHAVIRNNKPSSSYTTTDVS